MSIEFELFKGSGWIVLFHQCSNGILASLPFYPQKMKTKERKR